MKSVLSVFCACLLLFLCATYTFAQDSASAAQTAELLRAQLNEVQAKEAELQGRAKQLEEDLKPENIERSLAGIGSTRPEELREFRRRQLTIEKTTVRSQLAILAAQRTRLESSITAAETAAYHQSAQGVALNQLGFMQYVTNPRWLGLFLSCFLAVVAIVGLLVVIRRLNLN
jgi:hypothetical protein